VGFDAERRYLVVSAIAKMEIARVQLDRAIAPHLDHSDSICAVTLARASHELIRGLWGSATGEKDPGVDEFADLVVALSSPNEVTGRKAVFERVFYYANRLKHHDVGETDVLEANWPEGAADVIRMAKEKPGEVSYAATGRGRLTHLTMELLQARAGIKLQLIPYAGGPAQAMSDVMSGRVPLVLDGYAGLAPAIKSNLIKGLASTALKRPPGFENLPTIAETVPDFFVGAWNVLLAPVGTPEAIIRKVNADMKTALADPEVSAKLAANGGYVRHSTPEEVVTFVRSEQKTWRPILQQVANEAKK